MKKIIIIIILVLLPNFVMAQSVIITPKYSSKTIATYVPVGSLNLERFKPIGKIDATYSSGFISIAVRERMSGSITDIKEGRKTYDLKLDIENSKVESYDKFTHGKDVIYLDLESIISITNVLSYIYDIGKATTIFPKFRINYVMTDKTNFRIFVYDKQLSDNGNSLLLSIYGSNSKVTYYLSDLPKIRKLFRDAVNALLELSK